jgi:glycosyltransferase involved in cell wall biosynthesis
VKRAVIGIDARYGLQNPRRGIGEYVYQLLRHLAEIPRSYDIHLFGDQKADPDTANLFRQVFRISILPAANFFTWEQLAWARSREEVTVFHGTANIGPVRAGRPLVLTVHDVIEWHRGKDFGSAIPFRHHVSRFYRMNTLKYLAKKSSLIFTVSEHAAWDIRETLGVASDKIMITPLAPKYQANDITWPKKPFVLVLGAMDPRKNLQVMMDTATILAARQVRFKVVGIEKDHLLALMAQSRIPDNVELSGLVDDRTLYALYQEAALFVYPSLYEGFGLPLLEAMAMGCPVITGTNSSLPEIAGDAALFVQPLDAPHLAQAIWDVINNPLRQRQLAERGQQHARLFNWEKTAGLTDEGYRRVLLTLRKRGL